MYDVSAQGVHERMINVLHYFNDDDDDDDDDDYYETVTAFRAFFLLLLLRMEKKFQSRRKDVIQWIIYFSKRAPAGRLFTNTTTTTTNINNNNDTVDSRRTGCRDCSHLVSAGYLNRDNLGRCHDVFGVKHIIILTRTAERLTEDFTCSPWEESLTQT